MDLVASDVPLLARAGPVEFGEVVNPFRRELLVHCYRMLGSIEDAEDAVQDAYVKAWNGRASYRWDGSPKAWLYRIATNTCLDTLDHRVRRSGGDIQMGLTPIPDALLDEEVEPGPEARYDAREAISLAFLAALEALSPQQRAVLILRDVLGWRAAEVAGLLDLSVAAVNSALQRARKAMKGRFGDPGASAVVGPAPAPSTIRALLDRYVRAWEAGDMAGLVALLREDALLTMPPMPSVEGASAIGSFIAADIWRDAARRLAQVDANRSPAFVVYAQPAPDQPPRAVALVVLGLAGERIARLDAFVDLAVIARFAATPPSG
jgi:RNA polymerase sigma-70 factor (TIGR02960 family)